VDQKDEEEHNAYCTSAAGQMLVRMPGGMLHVQISPYDV